jgi:hypothetical protein
MAVSVKHLAVAVESSPSSKMKFCESFGFGSTHMDESILGLKVIGFLRELNDSGGPCRRSSF